MSDQKIVFKAFISYSHSADGKLAPAIQSSLQNFAKPWYKLRSLKLFRDETNLAISPGLWPSILEALKSAEYFILLASPQSAESKWVQKEVEYWINNRPVENLLIIQTEGRISYDEATGDFDWSSTTSLPKMVSNVFKTEPFYVDLSWAKSSESELSLRHSVFRKIILKIAATLLQKDMAELDSEEVRQFKKNKRYAWSAIVLLIALTISAIFLAIQFNYQKNRAEQESLIATSQKLAAQSESLKNEKLDLSLLLSLASINTFNTFEARGAILDALSVNPHIKAVFTSESGFDLGPYFFPDGKHLLEVNSDGSITVSSIEKKTSINLKSGIKKNDSFLTVGALSPDGKLLAFALESRILLWDIKRNKQFGKSINRHKENIFSLKFSPDGYLLASVSPWENIVYLWNVSTQELEGEPIKGPNDNINDITFSVDGKWIAIAGGTMSAFDQDGKQFAHSGNSNAVAVFNVKTRQQFGSLYTGHKGNVECICFNTKRDEIASGSDDGEIIVWDFFNQKPKLRFQSHAKTVRQVAFNEGGNYLASIGAVSGGKEDKVIYIWNLTSKQPVKQIIQGDVSRIEHIAFSPKGNLLASRNLDHKIMLWDLDARHPLADSFPAKPEAAPLIAISSDGQTVASTTGPNLVTLWNTKSLKQLGQPLKTDKGIIKALAFSFDNKVLASVSSEGYLTVLDVKNYIQKIAPVKICDEDLWTVAFEPSNDLVLVGGKDGYIYTVNIHSGAKIIKSVPCHENGVVQIAFGHRKDFFASSGMDDSIKVWKLGDWQKVAAVKGFQQYSKTLSFSPDDKFLAAGGQDGSIKLFESMSLNYMNAMSFRHGLQVSGLAYYPNGETLVSSSLDKTIIFWDIDRMEPIGTPLQPHRNFISALGISNDGTMITAGGTDIFLRWITDPSLWKMKAAEIANRELSTEEKRQYLKIRN